MGLGVLVVGCTDGAGALLTAAAVWRAVLILDGIISFSYALWPRRST
jgi:hypothetical protein